LNIWGEPETEIHAKIRYAKWNAVRIVKAIKEGKDPNESNPKPEPTTSEENLLPLDPHDPEVQQLNGQPMKLRQASVEEVPDEQDRVELKMAAQSILDTSLHPSAQPSAGGSPRQGNFEPYPRSEHTYSAPKDHEVSPLESTEPTSHDQMRSLGGGYYPEVPTFTADTRPSTFLTAPLRDMMDHSNLQRESRDHPNIPPPGREMPANHGSFLPPRTDDNPPAPPQNFRRAPQQPVYRQAPLPAFQPPAPLQSSRQQTYITDDLAIAKAQKHARWAISALNFEDVNTAVKELREALQTLGAS
jgi:vacuolar protein sorting-associated protein VTA1